MTFPDMSFPEMIALCATILSLSPLSLMPLFPLASVVLSAAWKVLAVVIQYLTPLFYIMQACAYATAFWAMHCGGHAPEEVYFVSCVLHGLLALLHRHPHG